MVEYTVALPPYDASFVVQLHTLAVPIFGNSDRDKLARRLTEMPDPSVHIARTHAFVAFKLGYAVAPGHYYSWLGGVAEEYRRRGIALRLMEEQHHWVRGRGYATIETGAIHTSKAMP